MIDLAANDARALYLQRLQRLLRKGNEVGPQLNDRGIRLLGDLIADTVRACIQLGAEDEALAILRSHRKVAAL